MAKLSLLFGILLIALGVGGFLLAGATVKVATALIPAVFGIVLILLAAVASKGHAANKHAMHVAAMVTLFGTLSGLGMGIPSLIKYLGGDGRVGLRAMSQVGLGVLSVVFLVFCIRSFINARKARLGA